MKQWTEEEFEKMCQADLPESPGLKEEAVERNMPKDALRGTVSSTEAPAPLPLSHPLAVEPAHQPLQQSKDATPPPKRGRGRPRRATVEKSPTAPVFSAPSEITKVDVGYKKLLAPAHTPAPNPHNTIGASPNLQSVYLRFLLHLSNLAHLDSVHQCNQRTGSKSSNCRTRNRLREKKQEPASIPAVDGLAGPGPEPNEQSQIKLVNPPDSQAIAISGIVPGVSSVPMTNCTNPLPISACMDCTSVINHPSEGAYEKETDTISTAAQDALVGQDSKLNSQARDQSADASPNKVISMRVNQENDVSAPTKVIKEKTQGTDAPAVVTIQDHIVLDMVSVITELSPEISSQKAKSGRDISTMVFPFSICPKQEAWSQGHNRAEALRRRGRRPAISDASSGQELNVISLPTDKSRELLDNFATAGKNIQDSGAHEPANITHIQASEANSLGASVGHDSERKVTNAIPAFNRIQTADVNDVARVMKEIFSETSSSKSKAGETAGSEGWNTPTAPLSNRTLDELDEKRLDCKSAVSTPSHEKAAPAFDVPKERKRLSVTGADAKEPENDASLVVEASVQRVDSLKPECNTCSESDASSRQNDGGKHDVSKRTPASGSDQIGSRFQPASPSPMEPPRTAESDKTNVEAALKEFTKADNTRDNDSETKKESPGMNEIIQFSRSIPDSTGIPSENSTEPSARGSLESSINVENAEGALNAVRLHDVTDYTGVSLDSLAICPIKSGMEEESAMVENNSEFEKREPSLKSYPKAAALDLGVLFIQPWWSFLLLLTTIGKGIRTFFGRIFAVSLGIESTRGNHVDPLEIEASAEKDVMAVSSFEHVPGDHIKMHLEVGVAISEGDSIQVENTNVNTLEAHTTSEEITIEESMMAEHVPNDQFHEHLVIKKTEAVLLDGSTVEPNSSEAKSSLLWSDNPDNKELVQSSDVDLVEASNVESIPVGPLSSLVVLKNLPIQSLHRSSLQSGNSNDKELVQGSEVDLIEACNLEANPTEEGPSSLQVISDESANPEITRNNDVRTELQSEDHAEPPQQTKSESTDVFIEIDSAE
ncbi:hypothetical protein F3Y22_tig00112159pilonHSYRG00374 [Hibiscus syriacus]|uniref:Uncharacterized protein n=1 Tax=Hibiscus syriacus TaxID=106335 RepID=A0A6A2XKQ5_HIBSY|nr:hypothetical protein F3Y22_tig00112159pilonHSYRG00374 [Hibiscus syriacus]